MLLELCRTIGNAELVTAAASNRSGQGTLSVTDDFAYSRIGEMAGGRWDRELRTRQATALAAAARELAGEVAYQRYLQFLFFRQWDALKAYANGVGVLLFGVGLALLLGLL